MLAARIGASLGRREDGRGKPDGQKRQARDILCVDRVELLKKSACELLASLGEVLTEVLCSEGRTGMRGDGRAGRGTRRVSSQPPELIVSPAHCLLPAAQQRFGPSAGVGRTGISRVAWRRVHGVEREGCVSWEGECLERERRQRLLGLCLGRLSSCCRVDLAEALGQEECEVDEQSVCGSVDVERAEQAVVPDQGELLVNDVGRGRVRWRTRRERARKGIPGSALGWSMLLVLAAV